MTTAPITVPAGPSGHVGRTLVLALTRAGHRRVRGGRGFVPGTRLELAFPAQDAPRGVLTSRLGPCVLRWTRLEEGLAARLEEMRRDEALA